MPRQYFNNAGSTLAANISDSATSIEVAAGEGARFGTPTVSDPVRLTLAQGSTREIGEATARTGDVLTVTRAVEVCRPDTTATAYAFTSGATVQVRATAASFGEVTLPASALGVFANIVGFYPRGNASDLNASIGNPNGTSNGTATGRAYSNSVFGAQPRLGFVSAASNNSPAGRTFIGAGYTAATEANTPAFTFSAVFGISDASC